MDEFPWKSFFLITAGVLVALATKVIQLYLPTAQAKQVQEKINAAEARIEAEPQKAKPAWDLARATLEAYFNRNLSQVSSIFWLSVVVMFMGFVVVVYGVFYAISNPEKITPAIIAALSGIITQFIGATFLFIYRSTITQAIDYSKTLERINSVGMAMQILDTMPDQTETDDLKSKTKATIVELLIRQSYDQHEKPEPTAKTRKKALRKTPDSPK